MKKIFIYLLAISMTALSIAGCGKGGLEKAKDETIPVRVMKVEPRDLNATLEYAGNIKGQDEAVVYPKVAGKIIEKAKEEGSQIAKGEAIVYIDRDEVGLKFEKAPVESPLDGIVGRVYVDIGSNVTPQTPVALVANMSSVRIMLDIPEKYMTRVSLGNKAVISVDAYPDKKFNGAVTEISPVVDLDTRAALVEITIDDAERLLRSGMFAKVKLLMEEHAAVPVILKEALIGRPPDTYVYVVEDKKARLTKVALGIREGPYFEVKDGLKAGDRVVIMGQQRLRDGASVEAEE